MIGEPGCLWRSPAIAGGIYERLGPIFRAGRKRRRARSRLMAKLQSTGVPTAIYYPRAATPAAGVRLRRPSRRGFPDLRGCCLACLQPAHASVSRRGSDREDRLRAKALIRRRGPLRERVDGVRDLRDLIVRELGEHRERQLLICDPFGDRKISRLVPELAIGALEMHGNRVMDSRLDALTAELVAKAVPLRVEEAEDVIDVPAPRNFARDFERRCRRAAPDTPRVRPGGPRSRLRGGAA